MSGLIGLRCDAGGFATRPDFSAQATGYAGGPYTNIECRKPQWQNTASAASTDRSGAVAEGMEVQSPSQPRAACIFSGWESVNRR